MSDAKKRKGRIGGAGMMVWLFFANLFEPAKVAAVEQIDTQRRIGSEAQRPVVGGKPSGDAEV